MARSRQGNGDLSPTEITRRFHEIAHRVVNSPLVHRSGDEGGRSPQREPAPNRPGKGSARPAERRASMEERAGCHPPFPFALGHH
jgi:hypothetical protein